MVRYKSREYGIDTEVWDPAVDKMLEKNYSIENFEKGKQQNKGILCTLFNLDPTKPLF
jgi:starch synthase